MFICKIRTVGSVLFVFFLLTAGCAPVHISDQKIVQSGDRVTFHYTCYLPSGELADSTRKESSLGSVMRKSAIYVPRKNDAPVHAIAGIGVLPRKFAPPPEEEFEFVIQREVSQKIIGEKVPDTFNTNLSAARKPVTKGRDYKLTLATVRHRPKQMKMTVNEFKSRIGEDPVIGKEFPVYSLIQGQVTEIKNDEVFIELMPGKRSVELEYGPAEIREGSTTWDIHIDPEIGRLIRIGSMVGRIVEKNDRFFVIDFAHPFGGEILACEVQVESVAATGENEGKQKP